MDSVIPGAFNAYYCSLNKKEGLAIKFDEPPVKSVGARMRIVNKTSQAFGEEVALLPTGWKVNFSWMKHFSLSLEKSVIGGQLLNFSRPARERQNAFKSFHLAVWWSPPPFGTHEYSATWSARTRFSQKCIKPLPFYLIKETFLPLRKSARAESAAEHHIFHFLSNKMHKSCRRFMRGKSPPTRALRVQNQRKRKRANLRVAKPYMRSCCVRFIKCVEFNYFNSSTRLHFYSFTRQTSRRAFRQATPFYIYTK